MVNNAGVGPEHKLIHELEPEKFEEIMLVFMFPSNLQLLPSHLADSVRSGSD